MHNLKLKYPTMKLPWEFWDNKNNMEDFLLYIEKMLQIEDTKDWYRVSNKEIHKYGGPRMDLYDMLTKYRPQVKWDKKLLIWRSKKTKQRWLYLKLKEIFKGRDVYEHYEEPYVVYFSHFESTLNFEMSKRKMVFDVAIPSLKLMIEYHGIQHYQDTPHFGPVELYIYADKEKREACEQNGLIYISIPFWWKDDIESLHATINQYIDVLPDMYVCFI